MFFAYFLTALDRCFDLLSEVLSESGHSFCLTISKCDNFNLSLIVHSEKMTKKKPRFGALPTLNLPKKSHESRKPTPRPERSIVKDRFNELCQRVKSLKSLKNWKMKIKEDRILLKKRLDPYVLPQLEIVVDDSLGFTVKVFGSYLLEDHPIYLEYRRTVQNVTVSNLIKELEGYRLCDGVSTLELSGKMFHHVIPVIHDSLGEEEEEQQFPHKGSVLESQRVSAVEPAS